MGIIQFIKNLFKPKDELDTIFTPKAEPKIEQAKFYAIFCRKCKLPLMFWEESKRRMKTRYCKNTKKFSIKCACGHTFNNGININFEEYILLVKRRCQEVKRKLIKEGRL